MRKSARVFGLLLTAAAMFAEAGATTTIVGTQAALDALTAVGSGDVVKIASNTDLSISSTMTVDGALYNSGTGTTLIGTTIGGSGTLVVESGAFELNGAATAYVGPGVSVQVASGGKFVFNAVASDFRSQITGSGTVDIAQKTNFRGANVTAGTINVVAGGTLVSASASRFAGTVNLAGGNIYSGSAFQNGGQLLVDSDLTIVGDLNCASWTLTTDASGNVTVSDYGSLVRLTAGKVLTVTGTAYLAGTLQLAGYSDSPYGKVYKLLSAGTLVGDWDMIATDASTLLVTGGVAGLGKNDLGIARIESKNLRSRDFCAHKGAGSFIDYLAADLASNSPNEVSQAVALAAGGRDLTDTVNAFSPSFYAALPAIALAQSVSEVDYLRRIFPVGLSAPHSEDGIHVEPNLQSFATMQYESSVNRRGRSSPTFDYRSLGATAGFYSWLDDERLAGMSLSLYAASAWAHGYGEDQTDDAAFRLRVFGGMMPAWASWNLIFGASAGGHYYDIRRPTALGINKAKERGFDMGFFAAWNARYEIGGDWALSPFVRLDFNYARVDTVREHGSLSALELGNFGYASWQTRLGFSADKKIATSHKDLDAYIGLEAAVMGNVHTNTNLRSHFVAYDNSDTSIKACVEDDFALELTPYFRVRLPHKWQFDLSYRVRVGDAGDWTQGVFAGLSTQF
ncbi:MAG: autotransporter domain-containing protein [Opitutales bacterium]|nr:autotransporter domain-containing protein [Opitutales bacterium]